MFRAEVILVNEVQLAQCAFFNFLNKMQIATDFIDNI